MPVVDKAPARDGLESIFLDDEGGSSDIIGFVFQRLMAEVSCGEQCDLEPNLCVTE